VSTQQDPYEPFTSPLDPSRGFKPLDFGYDGVTGSVDADGRLIALNTYHPKHGYVTFSVADVFPEAQRYNSDAVRAYRAALVELSGFGAHFDEPVLKRETYLLDDAIPQVRLELEGGGRVVVTTFAAEGGAFQVWQIEGARPRWGGKFSLQRCAYSQLTEGGPLPPVGTTNRASLGGGTLTVENPALPYAVAVLGLPSGIYWAQESDQALTMDVQGEEGVTVLVYGFGSDARTALFMAQNLAEHDPAKLLTAQRQRWRIMLANTPKNPLVRRGLVYGYEVSVPVGGMRAILTDHMLLPLSWNRDAFYVAKALLSWTPEAADIVRRHLLWLFEVAERTEDGLWGRCYTANGTIKDRAFQLDQQLYPLLELVDYVVTVGDYEIARRLVSHVEPVLEAVWARKAPKRWLFPTEETPADDPLSLPYHFSSHVLLWYVTSRLGRAAFLGPSVTTWKRFSREIVQHDFLVRHGNTYIFAYATDGEGTYHLYHDANDLPLALAPRWSFVFPNEPMWEVWDATVRFAFSDANKGGYYPPHGLGSVHTPAPWPLGAVQDVIIARVLRNEQREQNAWRQLEAQACWDGALPEASNAQTDAVVSRHWFAWPNAALACVALGVWGG